ncbi:MAG: tape measure protein [Pseudomonadota bacterium]
MVNSTGKVEQGFAGVSGSVKTATALIATMGLVRAAGEMIQMADAVTKMDAQLKNATDSQREFLEASDDAHRIATTAQADIAVITALYARLTPSLEENGAAQQEIADVSETVALSLKVMGASAGESSSAMLQLSQAFGSGRLAGEEFRAMMESAPNLMRALAASMGVPIGALKQMAADGEITSAVMQKAFTDPALLASLREQAKGMETISGSWQELKNELTLFVGQSAQASGATSLISGSISGLAKNIDSLAGGLQILAGIYAARLIPGMTKYLAAKVAESAAETASIAEKRASGAASMLKAQAEQTMAVSAAARAKAMVGVAEAEMAGTRMVLASIVAERELEATRLKSQITDKGRQLSIARLVELRTAEIAITAQLTKQEMALGAAQGVVLAETNALNVAHAAAVAAENAHAASTVRLTIAQRASAGAASLANGALALVGGTLGAVGLAAAGAAYLIVKHARDSAEAIDKVVTSIDAQIDAMSRLDRAGLENAVETIVQQIDALKRQGEAYQEAALAGAMMGGAIRRNAAELQAAEAVLAGYQNQLGDAAEGAGRFALSANDATRYLEAMETGVVETGNAFMTAHDYIAQMGGAIDAVASKSDDLITSLENQIKMVGMSAREQTVFRAELDAIAAESGPATIATMRQLAGTNYDLAESARVAKEAEEELANSIQSRLDSYSNVINGLGDMSQVAKLEFDISMGEFKGAKPEDIALMREHAESVDAIAWADKRREAREYFEATEAGLQKQIDLMGNTSKAAELLYDIEHGGYEQFDQDQKDRLVSRARELESVEAAYEKEMELEHERAQVRKQFLKGTQSALADALRNGTKDGAKDALKTFTDMLKDMAAQAVAADIMSWFLGKSAGGKEEGGGILGAIAGMFGKNDAAANDASFDSSSLPWGDIASGIFGGGGKGSGIVEGEWDSIPRGKAGSNGWDESPFDAARGSKVGSAMGIASTVGKFLGFFDNGGTIPDGYTGAVAEKRPELVNGVLVKGPANVTGGAQTAKMMGGSITIAPVIQISGIKDQKTAMQAASTMRKAVLGMVSEAQRSA